MWIFLALTFGLGRAQYYGTNPILITNNGHLTILSGKDGNITLKTFGEGYININNQNLLLAIEGAQRASAVVEKFQSEQLEDFKLTLTRLTNFYLGPRGINRRLQGLEESRIGRNSSNNERYVRRRLTRISRRVTSLERRLRVMQNLLVMDECQSNPCQHGGTCTDQFNGFFCTCPDQWEGPTCSSDVNECIKFEGTTLGCQHGSCRNKPGSYECQCENGWFGLHCTLRTFDCSISSSREVCGNGICVNQGGTGRGFTCICNPGWTTNQASGECTEDINECDSKVPHCSHDPEVICINTLGSYACGPCPKGYSGNGYRCSDIDECLTENGGCSISPRVQCINTRGSRVCGSCPPGYSGDGFSCIRAEGGLCQINNGGCYPGATCVQHQSLNYVQCVCPVGWSGIGVGPNGCQPIAGGDGPCSSKPCQNGGLCIPLGSTNFTCYCAAGFIGLTCDKIFTPCDPNPCLNRGQCISSGRLNYSCNCLLGFEGNRCQRRTQGCNTVSRGTNGTISWPLTNLTDIRTPSYGGTNCKWTFIALDSNLSIKIKFTSVNLPTKCEEHHLIVYEGDDNNENAYFLHKKICGKELPPAIVSLSSFLNVKLYSSTNDNSVKFKFDWEQVKPVCGETFNVSSHGSLIYPKFGKYRRDQNCFWQFITQNGRRIQFTFFSLKIENHTLCASDYLEIRDGLETSSPVLGKYCGEEIPAPVMTSGMFASIQFHSDKYNDHDGFQVAYTSVEGIPGCGGVFTSSTGTITSPGYDNKYHDNLNCEWKIQLPVNQRINIKFELLSLEPSMSCKYDYIEVFDGPNKQSDLAGKWCGHNIPAPFTSTSNILTVFFHSDFTYNNGGFVIHYATVCGGEFSDPEGFVMSPYYPSHYPEDRACSYVIIQPLGKAIKLNFLDFDLEESLNGLGEDQCLYDYLQVFDGPTNKSPLINKYCGTSSPPQILSTHNVLYLQFVSDSSRRGRGFKANYSTIDVGCGGVLTESSGVIMSPKYPEHYPELQECKWIIHAPESHIIQLNWQAFSVEKAMTCQHDWVAVYDNEVTPENQMGDKYCGHVLPPAMSSTSNVMSIVFHTDISDSEPGFRAAYLTTDRNIGCGGSYFTSMGALKSPNYPDKYPNDMECTWTINVPHGQQIELSIASFSLESGLRCGSDFLEIRNGGYPSSPLIKRYCGNSIDSEIISQSNQLYLHFVSDAFLTFNGFYITWNGALRGCGGTLTSAVGSIISPNYPQPYGRNGDCYWRITVSMGSVIQVTIIDIELEHHNRCILDYLELYDGKDKQSPALGRYCSTDHPLTITSKTNQMFIRFRSDQSHQGRGFHLKYDTACNQTITGFRGVIESPNFPDSDPILFKNCIWKIVAPLGNTINITFSHFEVYENPLYLFFGRRIEANCSGSALEVKEGSNGETSLGRFCGRELPPKLNSTHNNVFVHLMSSYKSIVRLEWIVSGCGGMLQGKLNGEFSSPGYPKAYRHSVVCEWYISVPFGKSIEITVPVINMEMDDECSYDSLAIYGGPDDTAPLLAKLCNALSEPAVQTTSGNEAFVRFETDETYNGKGFYATYKAINSECGGRFVAPSGSIHSKNYPKNYDAYDDCEFLIQIKEGLRINLTFVDFDVMNRGANENCSSTYVKVYDGESANAPLLLHHCGQTKPPTLLSTANKLFIRRKSDGRSTSKGFMALYRQACGATLTDGDSGTIMFQEGIDNAFSENCTWIIKSPDLESKIVLTFVLLELGSDLSNLDSNSVNIYAGEDDTAPLITSLGNNIVPPTIISSSSAVTISFIPSRGGRYAGRFRMVYSFVETACGGELLSEHGIIASPNYPDNAPPNAECVWIIKASPGNMINLGFSEINLPPSEFCNEDYVEIRAGLDNGNLLGTFCGDTIPQNITMSTNLWIKHRSGNGSTGKFKAQYSLVHGSEITGSSGQIASPLYPLGYTQFGEFTWRVTVKPKHVIRIIFKEVQLSYSSIYDNDYLDGVCEQGLEIFDGYDANSNVLSTLCGFSTPDSITSTSNVVYIKFITYLTLEGLRFLLEWMEMPKEIYMTSQKQEGNCTTVAELSGEADKNNSISFTSPGYPHGYGSNLHCSWVFETVPQNHIAITFDKIELEGSWECSADYINIYTVVPGSRNEWDKLFSLCHANNTLGFYEGGNMVKVEFETDYNGNETGFAATARSVCGGSIFASEGVITNKGWVMTPCKWNITVRRGRKIGVEFRRFKFPIPVGQSTCKSDYIILRDGGSEESPFLGNGKYCGTDHPTIPQTNSNKLNIEVSPYSVQQEMELLFSEVSINCGGDITLTKKSDPAIISSPNYPNVPPPHTECIWRIMAPSGESLNFEVTNRFDMSHSRGCTMEYIELRDGATEISELIGRYCAITPSYKTTKGNALYIKFFTDVKDPSDGFKAVVTVSKCGGTIYDSLSGTISSPGFPNSYASNTTCVWRLVAQEGYRYRLTFVTLDLGRIPLNSGISPNSGICSSGVDTVNITDIDRSNPQNASTSTLYCGRNTSAVIVTGGNEVLITFKSGMIPRYSTSRSFSIQYNGSLSGCGARLNLVTSQIKSPGYPSSRGNMYCFWRITVPKGRRVTFKVIDFDLEANPFGNIFWGDQRMIFYNDFTFSSRIATWYGSKVPGTTIESSGNKMLIFYSNKHPNNHRGFVGVYTSDEPAVCGGKLTGTNGSVNVPGEKMNSFFCEWDYVSSVQNGSTFTVEISGFVSSFGYSECEYSKSKLTVLDGTTGVVLGEFCSKTKENSPFVVSSPFDITKLTAFKVLDVAGDVNIVNFTIAWKVDECGGVVTLTTPMKITTPNFPKQYPANIDCVWQIMSNEGDAIKVTFESLNTPDCEDYLIIHNGRTKNSPTLGKYCGDTIPANIISNSNYLWFIFHSNSEKQGLGLSISLEPLSKSCGGIIHGMSGLLQSPNYPLQYKNNIECDWDIRTHIGYHLGLVFTGRFHIEESDGCSNDFLEVSDYFNGEWKTIKKLCGRSNPSVLNTTSNRMRVLFRTNDKTTGDGFTLNWYANCGGVIEASGPGHIYSPKYPNNYEGPLDCNYTVLAPGKVLSAKFNSFELEESSSIGCIYDKVEILAVEHRRPSIIGTHCGSVIPRSFTSKDRFSIYFVADAWTNFKGFDLSYDTEGCGVEITSETVIAPSTRNGKYLPNMNCVWNIIAPEKKVIIIKFSKLVLSPNGDCSFDYISIWDRNPIYKGNQSLELMARLCGNYKKKLPQFRTSSNNATFEFVTDEFHNTDGFSATILFKSDCSGTKELGSPLTTITLQSPISTNNKYEPLMDCHWVLQAPSQNTVQVTFQSLDVKNCSNIETSCSCDYIEIFDGISENDELIGRYCGTQVPQPVTSSDRFLSIKFVSDENFEGTGFILTASPVTLPCGPSLLNATDEPQELTSPGYPNGYQSNVHCRWIISSGWNDLDIHLKEVNIERSEGCRSDRLEVSELRGSPYQIRTGSDREQGKIYVGMDYALGFTSILRGSRSPVTKSLFCGNSSSIDYYSSNSRVELRFITDSAGSDKGFKLTYSIAKCTRNYTNEQGRILKSRLKEYCILTIAAPDPNATISLYFSSLTIMISEECRRASLKIYDGPANKSSLITTLCGYQVPNPIFSSSQYLRLEYTGLGKFSGDFDITYTTTTQGRGCGGYIFNYGGIFTSPLYPENYRNDSTCRWVISVPQGNVPVIEFLEFDLSTSRACLELYDQDKEKEVQTFRVKYCGKEKPARFEGTTGTVIVKYITSVHNSGIGWLARFMSKLAPGWASIGGLA